MSKRNCAMWNVLIKYALYNNSALSNFEPYSRELTLTVQRALTDFCPIKSTSYEYTMDTMPRLR